MTTFLYILITALVIGFLTFIHEFGHFYFARLFKVPIIEFAIGMGPKLFSWKGKKSGTTYSLRAFPIGGYVQMEGEEGDSDNPNAYSNLNPWKKIIVTIAGPLVNIIFAVVVMFIIVASTPVLGSTVVGEFYDESISNSQQQEFPLQKNDEIVQIGKVKIHTYEELSYEIMMQGYEPVDVIVVRDGKRVILHDVIFPQYLDEQSGTVLGVMDFKVYRLDDVEKVNFFDYLESAVFRSTNMVKMVFDSLAGLISGRFSLNAMSGPIGMVDTVGQMTEVSKENKSITPILNLIVLISMNLGIFNLLPIPALDGGRIVFHLIDGIAGRKIIKKEVEETIVAITMVLLLAFMLLISVKDVIKLF